MTTIHYDGQTYVLKILRLKCLACKTLAEATSSHPRSSTSCSCGRVSVDGGVSAGATIQGNPWAMEDESVFSTEDTPKVQLPQPVVAERHSRIRAGMLESYRSHGISEVRLQEIKEGRG